VGPRAWRTGRGASSAMAIRRRLRELGLRRADVLAWPTRGRASSLGAGERARCTQTATDTSEANCSSAATMVATAGLGVSREKGRRGGFYSRARVVRRCLRDRLTPRHVMGLAWRKQDRGVRRCCGQWRAASSGRRALPVGERHVDCPGNPLTSCTEANVRGAQTPGRGPVSACVYGEVRWRPTWRR
jgi:hypothetical protein